MAQILEPGDYRAKAVEAALGRSSKGTEQVAVRFSLLDFPQQTITWYGYFSEKAFEISMRGLRAAGFTGDNLADLSSLREEVSPEVVLVIDHDEYNGKVRPRVQFINGAGGMAVKDALDEAEAKTFAARMKGKVVAFDKAVGAPKAVVAAQAPAKANGRTAPAPRRAGPAQSDGVPQDVIDAQAAENVSDDIPF
jgi:hypothetical protein